MAAQTVTQLTLLDVGQRIEPDFRRLALIRILLLWAASDPALDRMDLQKFLAKTDSKEDVEPAVRLFFKRRHDPDHMFGQYEYALDRLETFFQLAER